MQHLFIRKGSFGNMWIASLCAIQTNRSIAQRAVRSTTCIRYMQALLSRVLFHQHPSSYSIFSSSSSSSPSSSFPHSRLNPIHNKEPSILSLIVRLKIHCSAVHDADVGLSENSQFHQISTNTHTKM